MPNSALARVPSAAPATESQPLVMPANAGYRVTQPFHSGHHGMDIAGPHSGQSVAVLASGGGIVQRASWHNDYGNVVIVYHGQLVGSRYTYTLYGHLQRFAVGRGQQVRQGQILGYSGQTGRASGVHLHFELILRNSFFSFPGSGSIGIAGSVDRVNPAQYVGRSVSPGPSGNAHSTLRMGARGQEVWDMQQRVIAWMRSTGRADYIQQANYIESAYRSNGNVAYFGGSTRTAVQQYQTAHGLNDDGIVGGGTWGKLDPAG